MFITLWFAHNNSQVMFAATSRISMKCLTQTIKIWISENKFRWVYKVLHNFFKNFW